MLGTFGTQRSHAAFVAVERDGASKLVEWGANDDVTSEVMMPFDAWRDAEAMLRNTGRSIGSEATKRIPWKGQVEIDGVTFRQRETRIQPASEGMPQAYEGTLEVRWSADAKDFVPLLEKDEVLATAPFEAIVWTLGPSLWLVERIRSHGSEGISFREYNALLCNGATKTCAVGYR